MNGTSLIIALIEKDNFQAILKGNFNVFVTLLMFVWWLHLCSGQEVYCKLHFPSKPTFNQLQMEAFLLFLFPLAHCAWRQCHKEKENLICTQFKFLKLLKCEGELSQVVNYQDHRKKNSNKVKVNCHKENVYCHKEKKNSFELNCPIEKVNWYLSRVKVNYDKVKVNYSKLKVNFMCKSLSCGASKLSQE